MWEAPTLFCVSYLCTLFLGSTNLPRRQVRDKGWHVHVPSGLWRYLQCSANTLDQWGQESGGGYWPWVCSCSKATFKKIEPVQKKTWLLGFS